MAITIRKEQPDAVAAPMLRLTIAAALSAVSCAGLDSDHCANRSQADGCLENEYCNVCISAANGCTVVEVDATDPCYVYGPGDDGAGSRPQDASTHDAANATESDVTGDGTSTTGSPQTDSGEETTAAHGESTSGYDPPNETGSTGDSSTGGNSGDHGDNDDDDDDEWYRCDAGGTPVPGPNDLVVSGQIFEDATWAPTDGAVRLSEDVQVGPSVTVTIGEGTTVYGNCNELAVFGQLLVEGSSDRRVQFNQVQIVPHGEYDMVDAGVIEIHHALLNNSGLFPPGRGEDGSLILTDSTLRRSANVYLLYPVADCMLARNVFDGTGNIEAILSDTTVTIRNNRFERIIYKTQSWEPFATIRNSVGYGTAEVIVEHNTFVELDQIAVAVGTSGSRTSMTATRNYWGTVDTAEIEARIYDNEDDFEATSQVAFEPVLTEPHPDTPTGL